LSESSSAEASSCPGAAESVFAFFFLFASPGLCLFGAFLAAVAMPFFLNEAVMAEGSGISVEGSGVGDALNVAEATSEAAM
jgi:hypothetical protein